MSPTPQMRQGISVVVPYVGSSTFVDMLSTLRQQSLDRRLFEIIVALEPPTLLGPIANCLADAGAVIVSYERPAGFEGHSAGILRNLGAAKARRRILMFADSDALFAPNCLSEHLRLHQINPKTVICGAWRELTAEKHHLVRGPITDFNDVFSHSLRDFRERMKRPAHWENLYSGNVSLPLRMFMSAGGFDERGYRCHDLDLGYRIFTIGGRFRFSPECKAVHIEHPRFISFRREQAKGWLNLAQKFPEVRAYAEDRAIRLKRAYSETVARCEMIFAALTSQLPGVRAGNHWVFPPWASEDELDHALRGQTYMCKLGADNRTLLLRLERNCWDYAIIHPAKGTLSAPRVSVIVTTFNSSKVIARAIQSVLKQSLQSFEIIAVDDRSTDGTEAILRSLAVDGRVRLLVNFENWGMARALNRGLEAARAPIVLQLDADDWLAPDALERIVACFDKDEEVGAVYACVYMHSSGPAYVERGYQVHSDIDILAYQPPQAPRAYKASLLRAIGGWSIQDVFEGRFFEDRLTLMRVASVAPVEYIDHPLYHVERRLLSLTQRERSRAGLGKLLILHAEANRRRMLLQAKCSRLRVTGRLSPRARRRPKRAWSIIIIAHGRAALLEYSLRSWLESDAALAPNAEIIVVDDGTPQPLDASIKLDHTKHRVRFVRSTVRKGPSNARNIGARHANNSMIFFSDGDHIVPPDVLSSHESRHDSCVKPAVVVGGLFGRKAITSVEPANISRSILRKMLDVVRFDRARFSCLSEAAIFGGTVDLVERNAEEPLWRLVDMLSFADPYLGRWARDATINGDHANGPLGFMRFRTGNVSMCLETFHEVGGFDPAMRVMEDWEFGCRCQKAGISIVSAPEIEPYHQVHVEEPLDPATVHASVSRFRRKHSDAASAIISTPKRDEVPGVEFFRKRGVGKVHEPRRKANSHANFGFLSFTFDDGPHPVGTPRVLNTLKAFGARATFFVTGANVVCFPEITREIVASGCELGVHGWEHVPVTEQTSEEIAKDLTRTAVTLAEVAGVQPHFCRPPYGKASAGYLLGAARAGLAPVGWDVSARDWNSTLPTELIAELAIQGSLGKFVLFHDGSGDPASLVTTLEWLLGCAQRRDVTILPVSEASKLRCIPKLEISDFII